MLTIIATIVITICGSVVFCADESEVALGLSFVVLLCSCIIGFKGCYIQDIPKLERLKLMCLISMAMVCFQLCIAAFRVRKYLDHGKRFALVTSIIYLIAQLTLIYSLHITRETLKKLNESKSSAKSSREQPVPVRVWV